MFRLNKRKIFLLYQYYLLGEFKDNKEEKILVLDWFKKCLEKEKYLKEKIEKRLKIGWEFSRLPILERAILIFATYELILEEQSGYENMIIDQTINFTKTYCEEDNYRYINKVLDLISKEKSKN